MRKAPKHLGPIALQGLFRLELGQASLCSAKVAGQAEAGRFPQPILAAPAWVFRENGCITGHLSDAPCQRLASLEPLADCAGAVEMLFRWRSQCNVQRPLGFSNPHAACRRAGPRAQSQRERIQWEVWACADSTYTYHAYVCIPTVSDDMCMTV